MTLKAQAEQAFHKWIIRRDKCCITCGSVKKLHGGHFHHNCLDFDEENLNAQCNYCNTFKHGQLDIYAHKLAEKIGQQRFDELYIRHYRDMKAQKREPEYYKEIIAKYTVENSLT